jgi:hypothetical protein
LVPYHARKLLGLKKVNEWLRRVREGASYYSYYILLLYRDVPTRVCVVCTIQFAQPFLIHFYN